jgi:hypothetical protein
VHDVVIVPGGGVQPDGSVAPWVRNRLDRALELSGGAPILCLSAGTVHKPLPLDARGRPLFEAAAGARYLLERGFDPALILTEAASWDTLGNAYFARVIHAEVCGWRRLLIVNSAFHMPRTEAIFRWVFALPPHTGYHLEFETVADVGMPPADLEFRRAREEASLNRVRLLEPRIRTIAGLHRFLFTEHDAYSAQGLNQSGERVDALERVY